MAIHCVFFTPSAEHTCQVLRFAGALPKVPQTRHRLAARYCRSGKFIACPIFMRVEHGLVVAQRFRKNIEQRAKARKRELPIAL